MKLVGCKGNSLELYRPDSQPANLLYVADLEQYCETLYLAYNFHFVRQLRPDSQTAHSAWVPGHLTPQRSLSDCW